MELSEIIKTIRSELNLSQEGLARIICRLQFSESVGE